MSEEKCKHFKSTFECSVFTVGCEPSYCDGKMDCGCELGSCLLENKRLREALEKIIDRECDNTCAIIAKQALGE